MKYKITEREIKAIANGDANIKDLFPDVFEVKLEVGKVYKTNYVNEKGVKSKFMAYIQDVEKMENYGFSFNGDFDVNMYFSKENHNRLSEATQKEWEEALIKEAERRGYKEGVTIKNHQGINTLKKINFGSGKYNNGIYNKQDSGVWIVFNGVWADIINTISKQEAENKLKEFGYECKIV